MTLASAISRHASNLSPRDLADQIAGGLHELARMLPDGADMRRMLPSMSSLPSVSSLSMPSLSLPSLSLPSLSLPTFGESPRLASGLANALGWFSLALGAAEMAAPGSIARAFGLGRHPNLVRLYGLREIAAGVGILSGHNRAHWLWGRVAGDILDLATLISGLGSGRRERANVKVALVAVAGVTLLDILVARALADER